MSRRVLLVYTMADDPRHTLVRGNLREWLARHGIPALWTPRLRGWCIRTERMADVLAMAEHEHLIVRLRGEAA